ncbi:MAG: type II toxin-antitoxin system RelE/ParE family toxin, partial [Draconibacterium sp.]
KYTGFFSHMAHCILVNPAEIIIWEGFSQLAGNELTANVIKELINNEPKLRGLKIGKHIVFYELIDEYTVEISRILHQSMDIKNKLKK